MAGDSLNLQDLAKHAQEIRERLLLAQSDLAETEVTGTADGGRVIIIMRGDGEITRVSFDQAAVDEADADSLAALTLTAIRHATDEVKSVTTEKMGMVSANLEAALGTEVRTY
jgi:DNA-binding YbaB/EbfC family protein